MLRGSTGTEFAGRLEGAQWDHWEVAAVADAGLRLLCGPKARHLTSTGQPVGWHRAADRGQTGGGRERNGGQMYDGATTARCSCGWNVTAPSQLGAREMARRHQQEATGATPE